MLLSARILRDCASVNSFEYADSAQFTKGDVVDVYFQLIDASLDTASENFIPPGRRYMPVAGATLIAVAENIDDAIKITRTVSQPFTNDPSIWKMSFFASDQIQGSANLRLTLTEGAKITKGLVKNAFRIQPDRNC